MSYSYNGGNDLRAIPPELPVTEVPIKVQEPPAQSFIPMTKAPQPQTEAEVLMRILELKQEVLRLGLVLVANANKDISNWAIEYAGRESLDCNALLAALKVSQTS